MDIILIGSGNAATVLGRASVAAGHRILQVYSRQEEHARLLARRLHAAPVSIVSSIEKKADLMIIAIRDEAIGPFIHRLGEINSVVAHTAGAVSLQEVRNLGDSYGVLYPLQSLRKEIETIPPLTILVDGNKSSTLDSLKSFTATITDTYFEADDKTRLKYHLAATVVNNFTNHLFSMTASFCEKENISFSVLQSLMEETVLRLRNISPSAAQTGPAVRNDLLTIQKHRDLLITSPALLKFYDLYTDSIRKSDPDQGL